MPCSAVIGQVAVWQVTH